MQIHAIKTATLTVKHNYRDAKGYSQWFRLGSALLDSRFIEIPVYTWAIEHPEGVIVIDTGVTAQATQPGYFPAVQRPFWRTQYRFHLTAQDEIGPQLKARGIQSQDVRWLVITHAHFDDTSALYHFPNSQVLFSRREWEDVQALRSAHFAFPSKWPSWLRPTIIDYRPEPLGPFLESYPLTAAGDVRLVPTPGHTLGHQSVTLQQDGLTYFFAGDTSFDLASLLQGTLDAPAMSAYTDYETRDRIRALGVALPTVYLPTHDPESESRLREGVTLPRGLERRAASTVFNP